MTWWDSITISLTFKWLLLSFWYHLMPLANIPVSFLNYFLLQLNNDMILLEVLLNWIFILWLDVTHFIHITHSCHIFILHESSDTAGVVEVNLEVLTMGVRFSLEYLVHGYRDVIFSCMLLLCSTESFNFTCFFLWTSHFVFVLFLLLPKIQ